MPPDTPASPLLDTEASERRALEAAVAEAWASVEAGRVTPHAQARAELLEFIARARERIAELDAEAPPWAMDVVWSDEARADCGD